MSSIVPIKIGKKTYLYISNSFRNDKGKPDTKRKCIGSIDTKTNIIIFNKYYLNYLHDNNIDINSTIEEILSKFQNSSSINKEHSNTAKIDYSHSLDNFNESKNYENEIQYTFSRRDLDNTLCRTLGVTYFLNKIATKVGLTSVLEDVFPNNYNDILSLAFFLVSSSEPHMYCESWVTQNITNSEPKNLTSQRISELLSNISFQDRMEFYTKWSKLRQESEYIANDITSISSYSNINEYVESGYNREGDKLKQLNLCLLFGEKSGLPIFSVQYPGSLTDVSTLCSTLSQFSILHDNDYKLVMDKGFYSVKNINFMIKDEKIQDFLVAVPFRNNFAKDMLFNQTDIVKDANIVSSGSDIIYSNKIIYQWKSSKPSQNLYLYTFYNQNLFVSAKEALYKKAFMLINKVITKQTKPIDNKDIKKYLIMPPKNSSIDKNEIKINIDQINKEIKYTGWLIILGSADLPAEDVINIYRSKDVVEKGFEQLKERLQLRRLRVHSSQSSESKVFISFISHILLCHINKIMQEYHLYQRYTLKELLQKLQTIILKDIKGNLFLNELTATQKSILKIFDFPPPDRKSRL
jgi:transposase